MAVGPPSLGGGGSKGGGKESLLAAGGVAKVSLKQIFRTFSVTGATPSIHPPDAPPTLAFQFVKEKKKDKSKTERLVRFRGDLLILFFSGSYVGNEGEGEGRGRAEDADGRWNFKTNREQ